MLFFSGAKRFLPKFIRSNKQFVDPLSSFTPAFKSILPNFDFIFPLLVNDNFLLVKQLAFFENCLIFLLNFFYKSDSPIKLDDVLLNFLYNYLIYSGLLLINKKVFTSCLNDFKGATYADFTLFLVERFDLIDADFKFHKERIIVEYTAFKR